MLHPGEVGLGGVREEPAATRAGSVEVHLQKLFRCPQFWHSDRKVANNGTSLLGILPQPIEGVVVVGQQKHLTVLKGVVLADDLDCTGGIQGEDHLRKKESNCKKINPQQTEKRVFTYKKV